MKNYDKYCYVVVIFYAITATKYITQSINDTSSFRLNPSKLKGFKTTTTVNPFVDLTVSKISTTTVWSNPYPALAT